MASGLWVSPGAGVQVLHRGRRLPSALPSLLLLRENNDSAIRFGNLFSFDYWAIKISINSGISANSATPFLSISTSGM